MRSCYICGRKSTKAKNISFHKFPKRPEMRKKWIKACRLQETDDVSHVYICSRHFKFPRNLVANGTWRLPPGAIPNMKSINNAAINSISETSTSQDCNNTGQLISKASTSHNQDCNNLKQPISETSTSQDCNNIGQLTSEASTSHNQDCNNAKQPISEASTSHSCQLISKASTSYNQDCNNVKQPVSETFTSQDCNNTGHLISGASASHNQDCNNAKQPISETSTSQDCNNTGQLISGASASHNQDCDNAKQPILEASTSHLSFGEDSFSLQKKRLFAEPRYISEITISDVSTPKRARRVINFVKIVDEKKSQKIKSLQNQNRRLLMRITTLQNLLSHFKSRNNLMV